MKKQLQGKIETVHNSIYLMRRILCHESNKGQRFKRLLVSAGWQIWKRTVSKPIMVNLFNGYRFLAYPDCQMSSAVFYFRVPDCREVEVLRRRLNGGVLIDVGSNVGLFTLSLADKVDHAILFEPNLLSARRAMENIALNSLEFEVNAVALSDQGGEIYLEDRGKATVANRTLMDPGMTTYPVRKVPRTTLDIFLKDRLKPIKEISLLKIDVEGHENSVIKGMSWTLTHLRPRIVMFEYLQRTNFSETKTLFDAVGYRIYSLDERNDLIPVSTQPEPLQNLFALRDGIESEIGG
ncbi:MAG: FkbM family methyltransferase [Pseudomonadota bacterium]